MGFYASYIFPRLMDRVMRGLEFQQLRTDLLKNTEGEVLEIGLGTGLNLACYPPRVLRLRAVDPAPLLPVRVTERRAAVAFPVEIIHLSDSTTKVIQLTPSTSGTGARRVSWRELITQ